MYECTWVSTCNTTRNWVAMTANLFHCRSMEHVGFHLHSHIRIRAVVLNHRCNADLVFTRLTEIILNILTLFYLIGCMFSVQQSGDRWSVFLLINISVTSATNVYVLPTCYDDSLSSSNWCEIFINTFLGAAVLELKKSFCCCPQPDIAPWCLFYHSPTSESRLQGLLTSAKDEVFHVKLVSHLAKYFRWL